MDMSGQNMQADQGIREVGAGRLELPTPAL